MNKTIKHLIARNYQKYIIESRKVYQKNRIYRQSRDFNHRNYINTFLENLYSYFIEFSNDAKQF